MRERRRERGRKGEREREGVRREREGATVMKQYQHFHNI